MTVTTFGYTGASEAFTVPAGITSILCVVYGSGLGSAGLGGQGGRLTATYPATPGAIWNILVGGYAIGGGGLGYASSLAGGGSSDIRIGGNALADRVLVAGGGGGASSDSVDYLDSGGGGGSTGISGQNGYLSFAGTGGSQVSGGTGGSGGPGVNGTGGALGTGGNGGNGGSGGGGGGGGYYGGGGGESSYLYTMGASGSGGSSYYTGSATSVTDDQNMQSGFGQVSLTYFAPSIQQALIIN